MEAYFKGAIKRCLKQVKEDLDFREIAYIEEGIFSESLARRIFRFFLPFVFAFFVAEKTKHSSLSKLKKYIEKYNQRIEKDINRLNNSTKIKDALKKDISKLETLAHGISAVIIKFDCFYIFRECFKEQFRQEI